MKITIKTTEHFTPDGRGYLRFTPALTPDCCAKGSLEFACWEVWTNEPHTHDVARHKAIANARNVLADIAFGGDYRLKEMFQMYTQWFPITPPENTEDEDNRQGAQNW